MSIRSIQASPPAPASRANVRQGGEPQPPLAASARPGGVGVSGAPQAAGDVSASFRSGSPAAAAESLRGEMRDQASAGAQERLLASVMRARESIETRVRDFSFSVHEETGDIVVRIIDRESKEVIRQIPAEEMLRIAERLKSAAGDKQPGLLLRQEA